MAYRRPLKLDGGNLRAMSSAEVNLIVDEVVRLYGNDPSVTIEVNPGNGNLTTLTDYRLTAGPVATSSSPSPSADPADFTTVTYDNTVQSIASLSFPYRTSTAYQNHSYPVYLTGSGDIQAMSKTDIYDTFISPALQKLVLGTTTSEGQAGTYFLSTNTSESDASLVSSTPVAVDTTADISAFNSGNLPEDDDQSITINSFYLHRIDPIADVDYIPPVSIVINENNLQACPSSAFRPMLSDLVRYHAANTAGSSIRYDYYLSGSSPAGFNIRGTGITDTYTSSSVERLDQNAPNPNATIYYAQNVPSGTPTVQTTHFLNIGFV
jgi:hypothetical protein